MSERESKFVTKSTFVHGKTCFTYLKCTQAELSLICNATLKRYFSLAIAKTPHCQIVCVLCIINLNRSNEQWFSKQNNINKEHMKYFKENNKLCHESLAQVTNKLNASYCLKTVVCMGLQPEAPILSAYFRFVFHFSISLGFFELSKFVWR